MESVSIQLHEHVSVESLSESLRELLASKRVPPSNRPLEQTKFLQACRRTLNQLLLANVRNSYAHYTDSTDAITEICNDISCTALKRLRRSLNVLMETDAQLLAHASDGHRVPGWNRMMLMWIVICQLNTAIVDSKLIHNDNDNNDNDNDNDNNNDNNNIHEYETPLDFCAAQSYALRRNELVVFGTHARVGDYSMSQWRLAMDVLRSRIDVVDTFDRDLARYIAALECRASLFIVGTGSRDEYDEPTWRSLVPQTQAAEIALRAASAHNAPFGALAQLKRAAAANAQSRYKSDRSFVVTSMWWLLYLKQSLSATLGVGGGALFASRAPARNIEETMDEVWWPSCERASRHVVDFALKHARSLRTDDHVRAFRKLALEYELWPGSFILL